MAVKDAGGTLRATVVIARGTIAIAKAMQDATLAAAAGRCVLVAGLVPISGSPGDKRELWQFSLSHWGQPRALVSVHRYKRDAEAQAGRVYAASAHRDLSDGPTFAAFIQELPTFGDREVGPEGV